MYFCKQIIPFIIINNKLFLGKFTVPSVSGQCCLPTNSFTIQKINQNKGIMFGGVVTPSDLGTLGTTTNSMYIFNVTHNTIVSYYYHTTQMICEGCKFCHLVLCKIALSAILYHNKYGFNFVIDLRRFAKSTKFTALKNYFTVSFMYMYMYIINYRLSGNLCHNVNFTGLEICKN